jgi:hypothetical protein
MRKSSQARVFTGAQIVLAFHQHAVVSELVFQRAAEADFLFVP